jgi:hypothetical protein
MVIFHSYVSLPHLFTMDGCTVAPFIFSWNLAIAGLPAGLQEMQRQEPAILAGADEAVEADVVGMEVSLNYVGHVWIANFGIATRKD